MNDDPFQKAIAALRLFYPGSLPVVQTESEIPATADSGPPHQGTRRNLPGIFRVENRSERQLGALVSSRRQTRPSPFLERHAVGPFLEASLGDL
jgi:hypothetical protein